MIVFKKNDCGLLRVGWTIPRKFGKASTRNKFKRWLRFYFSKQDSSRHAIGYDINVIFRKPKSIHPKSLEYSGFAGTMEKVWAQLK